MVAIDTTERLMNLAIALRAAREPRTAAWIGDHVDGYEQRSDHALKKIVGRDVDTLREQGFDITGGDTNGYQMVVPKDHTIVRLTFDELQAVNLATQYCLPITLQPIAVRALTKLSGVVDSNQRDLPAGASLPGRVYETSDVQNTDMLHLFRAITERLRITCSYYRNYKEEPQSRYLEPWSIVPAAGQWYLVAYDLERSDVRVFRISRLSEFAISKDKDHDEEATHLPDPDVRDYVDRQIHGRSRTITATVVVKDNTCPDLQTLAQDRQPHPTGEGEQLTVTGEYRRILALCTGYGADARVVEPAELIDDVCASFVATLDNTDPHTPLPRCSEGSVTDAKHTVDSPRAWRKNDKGVELARLLSLLPYLREHPGASSQQLADHFGVPESQIERDLETLVMCGQPGMQYHQMVQISLDKDNLRVVEDQGVGIPTLLGVSETGVVLLAIETLLSTPELAHLSSEVRFVESARQKLRESRLSTAEAIASGGDLPPVSDVMEQIAQAKDKGSYLLITYASASSGTTSERKVAPHSVVASGGQTYLWAGEKGTAKTFRLDRIQSATVVDEPAPAVKIADNEYDPFGFAQSKTWGRLAIVQELKWLLDYEQMWFISENDDYFFVDVPYASSWLESFVLSHGGKVIPVEPRELIDAVRHRAQEALVRYRSI